MSPEEWYKGLPPVTKVYWTTAVIVTILSSIGALNPMYIYLDFDLVFKKFQIWRLLTNFFFFGNFSMAFIFQVVLLSVSRITSVALILPRSPACSLFLTFAALLAMCVVSVFSVRYVGMLEEKFGRDVEGTAAMLTMLSFGVVCVWILGYTVLPPSPFYGSALVFMCIYVWSRSDPFAEIVMYGFSFKQWHTPFLFLCMGLLLGGNPMLDLLGIGLGHLYFFLTDMVPRNWGKTIMFTPRFMVDAVKWAGAKWAGTPVAVNSAAPRPNWQQGQGHRLG